MTTCARCNHDTGYKLPLRQSDGEILYFHVNAAECHPDLAPATNTEARQLAELDAEQPEAQPIDSAKAEQHGIVGYNLNGFEVQRGGRQVAIFNAYDNRRVNFWHAVEWCERNPKRQTVSEYIAAQTSAQPAAQLFDPIATLPLFSGTAPRVDDPGRYDPPAVSTDTQPSLF